jgi:hypothetical protein
MSKTTVITVHCGGHAAGLVCDESILLPFEDLRDATILRKVLAQRNWILDTVVAGPMTCFQPYCAACARQMKITGAPRSPEP